MKLYDTPMAPNPRRVRWVMAEKAITDIEVVTLNLIEGGHKTADYLGKAGLAHVPMLEMDDGTCITESVAICRFLESRYPEPNLFGADPTETAVIEMWTRRAEMLVATPMMLGVRHTHPALAALEQQEPAVADYNLRSGGKGLEVLDKRLGESAWIAVDRVTMADIVAFIGIEFGRLIRFRPPEGLKNLGRWMDDMRARPAAQATK